MGLSPVQNNIELQKQIAAQMAAKRAAVQTTVNGTPASSVSQAPVRPVGVNSGEPVNYKVGIEKLAQEYAARKTGETPAVAAAAGAVSYVPQQAQPEYKLPNINTNTVLAQRAANNIATPNAVKFISKVAASPYQQTASSYPNMDMYNQLAKIKLG